MAVKILWIYVVLLMVGGLMGLIRGKSKISLITSSLFAILLALCALGVIHPYYVADILLGLLVVVFGIRYTKGKKFMPSGFMLMLTAVALVAHLMSVLMAR